MKWTYQVGNVALVNNLAMWTWQLGNVSLVTLQSRLEELVKNLPSWQCGLGEQLGNVDMATWQCELGDLAKWT
jgi:hypothetical protein